MLLSEGHRRARCAQGGAMLPGRRPPGGALAEDLGHRDSRGGTVITVGRQGNQAAGGVGRPVGELVTMLPEDDLRPIRLDIFNPARVGRYGGHDLEAAQQRGQRQKDALSHGRYFLRMKPWPEPSPSQTFGPSSRTTFSAQVRSSRTLRPFRYWRETVTASPLVRDGS